MLWIMLKKDLLRVLKKPGQYVLMLIMPMAITGLVGIAFKGGDGGLPPIEIGYVDEDQAFLGGLFSSAFSQSPITVNLKPMTYVDAMAQLNKNKLNAVIRIPKNFTEQFLAGQSTAPLVLVKNPADRYLAAIVEEMLLLFHEALNALSYNLSGELGDFKKALSGEKAPDPILMAALTAKVFEKVQHAEAYLFPPLLGFHSVSEGEKEAVDVNIFATLLPGLAGLFMLFLADLGIRDLFKEQELKTLERYMVTSGNTLVLVFSKVLLAMMIVVLGSMILLWAGGALFGVVWSSPLIMAGMVLCYALCCAGLMAGLSSLLGSEKKANVLNAGILMAVGFLGGSMLPVENLPPFVVQYLSPNMPNYWLSRSILNLQYGMDGPGWPLAMIKMTLTGVTFLILATVMLNRRLNAGVRS